MRDQELVNALRCVSTAGGPIGDCKKCPFYKMEPVPKNLKKVVNLTEWSSCDVDAVGLAAADRIANQNTHIAALQQEIEKLRGQNEQLREAAALVAKESAELLERRWIPVEGKLYPGDLNRAAGGSGFNPFYTPAYVPNPAAPRNCCAGGFGSTKIGEEVENAETE